VEARREGRHVWYAVTDPRIRELVSLARAVMADHAAAIASCARLDAEEGTSGAVAAGASA
jgi:hypothetical protein